MHAHHLRHAHDNRTDALVFDAGDEVIALLSEWCRDERLPGARFTAIGAFSQATVGWFDWDARSYRDISFDEQVEVLSLMGDVAADPEGRPSVHAHVVLGRSDGAAVGGHLLRAVVRPTLELVIDVVPAHLRKRVDDRSGLALIDLEAGAGH
ncbi:DNA-binding protein [Baekduia soli]|uniref:DNA-binding protein n=1 Tax=Baekduia soli TaxID=496014 RepID=A0A5B8U5Q4_9ACTN|nr:PPC domain-containing DNA-binding protein [Baekduia soli]QEC48215.1 DNA-binding protein [Baekduia soli]